MRVHYFSQVTLCSKCRRPIVIGRRIYYNPQSDAFCSVKCLRSDAIERIARLYAVWKVTHKKIMEV